MAFGIVPSAAAAVNDGEIRSQTVIERRHGSVSMKLQLEKLGKRYDGRPVLSAIDLDVPPGEFLLLCGANGAGKSTLLRILATLIPPSSGRLRFDGRGLDEWGPELRRRIGVLLHESLLYGELTAEENLLWVAKLYGIDRSGERVRAALERVGMRAFAREQVARFSRGMKQRISLARCLVTDPDVVLLDEPYEGLDRRGVDRLQRWLRELKAEGRTVVVVAHQWEHPWPLADRVLFLAGGRLVHNAARSRTDPERWRVLMDTSGSLGEAGQ